MIIDIGDLTLTKQGHTKQEKLFNAIRNKIVSGLWKSSAKLPSTRELATRLAIGRNTVVATYEQLVAEGYIKSQVGSGFYVAVNLPEQFYVGENIKPDQNGFPVNETMKRGFAPGVPDLEEFPVKRWSKLVHQHGQRRSYLGYSNIQGLSSLRNAIANYISSSRSVYCSPDQVIITHGAQQAISTALLATASYGGEVAFEDPGYTSVRSVIELFNMKNTPVKIDKDSGWNLTSLTDSEAKAVYVTPSNQYPLGMTMPVTQRLELVEWASGKNSFIIEDDYDSEFQFAHQPYPSLQGLAHEYGYSDNVIYIGSLSKIMFNSIRLGYMVVPSSLITKCCQIKQAMGGELATTYQLALTQFLTEGHLQRHIRKMRRLYQEKHQMIINSLNYHFGADIKVISQPAGLHVTIIWEKDIAESTWSEHAKNHMITLKPLSEYESYPTQRSWKGAILGFGNAELENIDENIADLARLFYRLDANSSASS
ncbi:MocR-like pyridoxine biosynthesis transcription factor PdxR [Vibrio salinus]|uniref:MocR-like pyridoxine biosynthesis transcription factor PdxR n=1 Tax=Vibrio salinus TaxID=2899784 RepID=UPI001E37C435|nr:PLP-dependent aminotransferase family protein [Vibrio salinus]MCE0494806.1 PLP-dependent aminotransferase family protein [Vibrio salinus]